ncbi:family 78 glycoside hydrolase catalytic domain [Streptomyces sp. NPDC057486]|uniref:family 78 glycoside hydrolase catalytic domain n=1 Tax=Streptomyces sp. NPDC057486 TaxID=3346145 RepID=UPI003690FB68
MAETWHEPTGLPRRRFLKSAALTVTGLTVIGAGAGLGGTATAASAGSTAVDGLSMGGRSDWPLGVDDRTPLLAWRLERGMQSAYRIRVASSPGLLPTPDLWDSGWVESSTSSGVVYGGKALKSRQRAAWQVRIRDADGRVSDWSSPSSWEAGLLDPEDWSPARWIAHASRSDADPLPVFARAFTLDGDRRVDHARLYLAGLGIYVATVNGHHISDAVLEPGNTNPQQSVEAGTYDVTALLATGRNTLGVQLGNGVTNVGSITNAAVGRTSVYRKYTSTIAKPTTLAAPAAPGDTTVRVANVSGFAVGATLNIDTGDGGARLESRVITAVGTDIAFDRPLAEQHASGATVTRSGTPNATITAISPRLIARLEIVYTDGHTDTYVTDEKWRTALGPTVTDNWYAGSDYDARREQPGWDRPGADLTDSAKRRDGSPTGWAAAGIAPPPNLATKLTWRRAQPVRIVDTVSPVAITEPVPGTWVFDFGQNAAALPELHVDGSLPAGTVVRMQPAESLKADGTVDSASLGSGKGILETYTTFGAADGETWRPQFGYHGFQYIQVTGLPSGYQPDTGTVTARHVRASARVSGDVSTSSERVNRLHRMSRYSIASNMMSIFTDCPGREKLGWLADMLHSMPAIDRNFDMSAYLPHMERVMREAQLVDGPDAGLVPEHTPEFPVFDGQWAMYRNDINWGSAVILAPWWLWRHHGDTETMAVHYQSMTEYHDYVRTTQAGSGADEHLVNGPLKDWVAHDESTPGLLVGTYAYYLMTDRLAQMAAHLRKGSDAGRYRALAGAIKAAFNNRFFNDELRTYTNDGNAGAAGTQAANALALEADLVPRGQKQHVLRDLVSRIRDYHPNGGGPHVSGGTISLGPTFRALSAADRDDVIWEVLHEDTRPGYGSFLLPTVSNPKGMTTVPEHWYAPDNNSSLNHMILLQIDEWFSAGLAGIQQAPDSIAYERIVVKPKLVGTPEHPLTHVEGSYEGPRGRISSAWRISGPNSADLALDVTIPANTAAEIHVPTVHPSRVRLDGRPVSASKAAVFKGFADGYAVYSVGLGTYALSSRLS